MRILSGADRSGDRKGMLMAGLCFVHCVAGPLLLSAAGLGSLTGISEKLEPLFMLSSLAFGMMALIPGYRRKHRRFRCLALFFCGLFCLLVLRHLRWTIVPEVIATGIGAALIVAAHALNLRLGKSCECCEAMAHDRAERLPGEKMDSSQPG